MKQKFKKISNKLKSKFYFDYNISNNVWFRTGGKVSVYCIVYDQKELEIILNNIGDTPYIVIGGGSNLLVRDKGYKGVLFKLGKEFNKMIINENSIKVGAGILDVNLSTRDETFIFGIISASKPLMQDLTRFYGTRSKISSKFLRFSWIFEINCSKLFYIVLTTATNVLTGFPPKNQSNPT